MLLDASVLRLLNKNDFRVLRAVELGMRNVKEHEIVPIPLILTIARQRQSVTVYSIRELLKHKLLHHENVQYDGYRLTNAGYDFLALHTLVSRGQIHGFGRKIGTGKESDIYEATNEEGEVMIMKLHRLGRTSFRAVKNKRDYLRHRTSFNWLYLSRLAALGEYAFMKALHKRGFPVPEAIDQNRHVVLMSVAEGYPLAQVKEIGRPGRVFKQIMEWLVKFVEVGLVHCDFNEFNLMITDCEEITIIDFPQMVSIWHENAEELFNRDRECIIKRFHYNPDEDPALEFVCPEFGELVAVHREKHNSSPLDQELHASGFKAAHREILEQHAAGEELGDREVSDASEDRDLDDEATKDSGVASERTASKRGSRRHSDRETAAAKKVTSEQRYMKEKTVKNRSRKNSNKERTNRKRYSGLHDI